MNRIATLLGGATRGNIVEALALSAKPLTAYRVAKTYNMNVARVYIEMKTLVALGMVGPKKGRGGLEYGIIDGDLRSLALKLSSRVQTYEAWRSKESKLARFKLSLAVVPPVTLAPTPGTTRGARRRMPGELENLAALGRKKFDTKYRRAAGRRYARV